MQNMTIAFSQMFWSHFNWEFCFRWWCVSLLSARDQTVHNNYTSAGIQKRAHQNHFMLTLKKKPLFLVGQKVGKRLPATDQLHMAQGRVKVPHNLLNCDRVHWIYYNNACFQWTYIEHIIRLMWLKFHGRSISLGIRT